MGKATQSRINLKHNVSYPPAVCIISLHKNTGAEAKQMTSDNTPCFKRNRGGAARLADKAAENIRKMIIENMFDPGEPLSELRLAEMMGMSRTPVREAITLLEQEGLLRTVTGKGAFVAELTRRDFQEVNDIRMVLEPLAAVSALNTVLPAELAAHKNVWMHFLSEFQAGKDLSAEELTDRDDELHFMYIDKCENARLKNFLRVLRFQTNRYIYAHWSTREYLEETIKQHLEIIKMMQKRDTKSLRKAVEVHIEHNNRFVGIYLLDIQSKPGKE